MVKRSSERGAVTAEYAVGMLAATSIAVTLIHIGLDGWYARMLWHLIQVALQPGVLLDQVRHLPELSDWVRR